MKHTETTLRFPVSELTVGGSTTECTNLRFSDAGIEGVSALIPTRGLTPTAPGGLIPLGRICLPDTGGDVLLATADRCADGFHELIVITAEGDITVHRTSAIVYCAVAEGSGWLVMTSAGHITVRCGATLADCSAITSTTAPPVISLTAIDCGTISRPVETLTLTDTDFSRDTPALSHSGARQLSEALISAYSAIASGAAENDAWFQPLLARFRLLNAAGHTLYTSEPQLITSRGWQCTSLITFEGSKNGSTLSLNPLQLEADIYSIRAKIHSLGGYADTAKTVEISVTPQLHPADFSAEAPYRIVRPSTDSPHSQQQSRAQQPHWPMTPRHEPAACSTLWLGLICRNTR